MHCISATRCSYNYATRTPGLPITIQSTYKAVKPPKQLLHIMELGEYPDLTPVFGRHELNVHQARSLRKGLATLNRLQPEIIVAEFNYLPTYGTQLSNVESLLAKLQRSSPDSRVILFYHRERSEHLQQLCSRFPVFATLEYPVDLQRLGVLLQQALA